MRALMCAPRAGPAEFGEAAWHKIISFRQSRPSSRQSQPTSHHSLHAYAASRASLFLSLCLSSAPGSLQKTSSTEKKVKKLQKTSSPSAGFDATANLNPTSRPVCSSTPESSRAHLLSPLILLVVSPQLHDTSCLSRQTSSLFSPSVSCSLAFYSR